MDEIQSPSDEAAESDLNLGDLNLDDLNLDPTDLTSLDYDSQDSDLKGDTLREECGVFGIFGHPEAAAITALGLHALQHRGQEAAGIVSFEGGRFHSERRLGLVGDTFSRREVIDRLPGTSAVGHVRYSTTGETILRN
ncbi:MAG TPA: amidophosphoribosyltransferase, partial [Bradyrhizobium sp.]|nr:amidophosphoribosyltransferase [Bradyrhizobium sp.]